MYLVGTHGDVRGQPTYSFTDRKTPTGLPGGGLSVLPRKSKVCNYQADRHHNDFPDIDGRGRRIRTLGTRFWRPLLYQLSYAPI